MVLWVGDGNGVSQVEIAMDGVLGADVGWYCTHRHYVDGIDRME